MSDTPTTPTLKPCPFCGRAPITGIQYVGCQQCHVSPDSVTGEIWNTRPIESALESKLSAAEAKLAEKRYITSDIRTELARQEYEMQQELGKALGYPRYCDDPVNFPGATEADGVFVGEHVAASLVSEAAHKITELQARVKEFEALLDRFEPRHDATCGIHMDLTRPEACTCELAKTMKALNL